MLNMQQQMIQMAQIIDQLTNGQLGLSSQISDEVNASLNEQQAAGNGQVMQSIPNLAAGSPGESNITKNARQRAAQTTSPT